MGMPPGSDIPIFMLDCFYVAQMASLNVLARLPSGATTVAM